MQCPSDAPSNAHPMLSAFGRWREIAKIFRNPRGGRTLSTGRAPQENSRPETHPTQQTPAFVDAQPMPEGMPNRCPTMPEVEVEVENYKPLNSPSTPTSPNLTRDEPAPSPTPAPDPDAPATMDGHDEGEPEAARRCRCVVDPSGLVGGPNPSTESATTADEHDPVSVQRAASLVRTANEIATRGPLSPTEALAMLTEAVGLIDAHDRADRAVTQLASLHRAVVHVLGMYGPADDGMTVLRAALEAQR